MTFNGMIRGNSFFHPMVVALCAITFCSSIFTFYNAVNNTLPHNHTTTCKLLPHSSLLD